MAKIYTIYLDPNRVKENQPFNISFDVSSPCKIFFELRSPPGQTDLFKYSIEQKQQYNLTILPPNEEVDYEEDNNFFLVNLIRVEVGTEGKYSFETRYIGDSKLIKISIYTDVNPTNIYKRTLKIER